MRASLLQSIRHSKERSLIKQIAAIKIMCVPRSAGVMDSSTIQRDPSALTSPARYSDALFYFVAITLLSECDYYIGDLKTSFGKLVHNLILATRTLSSYDEHTILPYVFDSKDASEVCHAARKDQIQPCVRKV